MTSREPMYAKAPVVEVIIEAQFAAGRVPDLVVPGLVYNEFTEDFPIVCPVLGIESHARLSKDSLQHRWFETPRLHMLRNDERFVVQLGVGWVVLNHLAPYEGWENLRPVAERVFRRYAEASETTDIRMLSLTYMNEMALDCPLSDIEKFLTTRPVAPEPWAKDASGFFSTFELRRDEGSTLQQVSVWGSYSDKGKNAVLLTLLSRHVGTAPIDLEHASAWLDEQHHALGELFEAATTDDARALFSPRENS